METKPIRTEAFIICFLISAMLLWHIAWPNVSLSIRNRAESVDIVAPGPHLSGIEKFVYGIPIDINTATPDDLLILPGIGPKTAVRIVAERGKNGPFNRPNDLLRVKGIGPKKLLRIKRYLVF